MSLDHFGISVSLSGNAAVVGANQDDDAALSSGSAYVFNRSESLWSQLIKFVTSDAATGDNFGISVSASGSTAVVGAHKADTIGDTYSGSAYVFPFSSDNDNDGYTPAQGDCDDSDNTVNPPGLRNCVTG